MTFPVVVVICAGVGFLVMYWFGRRCLALGVRNGWNAGLERGYVDGWQAGAEATRVDLRQQLTDRGVLIEFGAAKADEKVRLN